MCGPTTGSFLVEKYCILIFCCRVENYTEQKAGWLQMRPPRGIGAAA